jgi:hypothetical protein
MIEEEGLKIRFPTEEQISNFIFNHRKSLYRKEILALENQFEKLLLEEVGLNFSNDETKMFCLYKNLSLEKYLIVFSSYALLKNLVKISSYSPEAHIHLDTTYNLMENGMLLMVLSTESKNHELRLISFAITISESANAYQLLIQQTIDVTKKLFKIDSIKIDYVLSDGSEAVVRAVKTVLPDNVHHILCYFHMMQAIERQVKKKSNAAKRGTIYWSIKCLKETQTLTQFSEMWFDLFLPYWKSENIEEEFINYFESQYIKSHLLWFDGAAYPGKSRTNNSVESFNKEIKRTYTQYKKLHPLHFIKLLSKIFRDYSILKKNSFDEYKIPDSILKEGQALVPSIRFAKKGRKDAYGLFIRSKRSHKTLEQRVLLFLEEQKKQVTCIQELYWYRKYFWAIDLSNNKYSCGCHKYVSKRYCKHSVAIQMHLGLMKKLTELTRHRSLPGRRKKVQKAYQN